MKTKDSNKKASNKKLLAITGVTALVAIGATAFFISKKSNKTTQTQQAKKAKDPEFVEENNPETTTQNQEIPTPSHDSTIKGMINAKLQTTPSKRLLVIGDSQVKRNFKDVILSEWTQELGLSEVGAWNKEGVTPAKVVDILNGSSSEASELKSLLSQKFPVIFIQLGDNGINGPYEATNLLRKILNYYPSGKTPLIIWSGPLPLCLPNGQSTTYVKAPPCSPGVWKCLPVYQDLKRNEFSNRIISGIANTGVPNIYFVSAYNSPVFSDLDSMPCFTVDGVHFTREISISYLRSLLEMKV